MNRFFKELSRGLWHEIPPFRLALGLCPSLAVTMSAENGLGMGIATAFVLLGSNILISSTRKIIPSEIRIACYIAIIATFVVVAEMLMQAYAYPVYEKLGIFVPLIVVNCIILGRAESFASRHPVMLSVADAIGLGVGFTLSLTVVGAIREMLGTGNIFGVRVMSEMYHPFAFMVKAPGAFICIGLILGLMNAVDKRKVAR